jgi:hypothetical protein
MSKRLDPPCGGRDHGGKEKKTDELTQVKTVPVKKDSELPAAS